LVKKMRAKSISPQVVPIFAAFQRGLAFFP
jgi:hypothetical protein